MVLGCHAFHLISWNFASVGHSEQLPLCRYRNLGVALIESPGEQQAKRAVKQAQKLQRKGDRILLRTDLQSNVNRNLPRNVPY